MKILITGVTGYIGQKLVMAALQKGYSVHALTRTENFASLPSHPHLTYFTGDITDYQSVTAAMRSCQAVMHCAGITQFWHFDRSIFYRMNVEGTRNLLEAACYYGIKKFVFTSSCAVMGPSFADPVCEEDPRITAFENDYEISKYCAEELVKEYAHKGLYTVIVNPPRVYGPGLFTNGNPLSKLIRDGIKKGLAFVPSPKNVVGNYAFIDDVVEGHFLAMEKGLGGERYILGGENLSYYEFFSGIKKVSGNKIKLIMVPRVVLKIASTFAYLSSIIFKKHINFTPKLIDRLFQNRAVSCEKAIRQLGYSITPFNEGVSKTIQFLKNENYV